MKIESESCLQHSLTTYRLTITDDDMARVRFDEFDRALLEDCSGDDATIADYLLALEMIARRIEEASHETRS